METKSQHRREYMFKQNRLRSRNVVLASSMSRKYFVRRHRNWQASSSGCSGTRCISDTFWYNVTSYIKLHQVIIHLTDSLIPSKRLSSCSSTDLPSLPMRSKERRSTQARQRFYAVTLNRRWSKPKHQSTSKYIKVQGKDVQRNMATSKTRRDKTQGLCPGSACWRQTSKSYRFEAKGPWRKVFFGQLKGCHFVRRKLGSCKKMLRAKHVSLMLHRIRIRSSTLSYSFILFLHCYIV